MASPIHAGHGLIWLSHNDRRAAHKRRLMPTTLEQRNAPIGHWTVSHHTCGRTLADLDEFCYGFDIEHVSTPLDLLARTAHISQKAWYPHTNWARIITDVAHATRSPLEAPTDLN